MSAVSSTLCAQQLPQIPILRVRYPDPREAVFYHEPQQELRILAIRLLVVHRRRTFMLSVLMTSLSREFCGTAMSRRLVRVTSSE